MTLWLCVAFERAGQSHGGHPKKPRVKTTSCWQTTSTASMDFDWQPVSLSELAPLFDPTLVIIKHITQKPTSAGCLDLWLGCCDILAAALDPRHGPTDTRNHVHIKCRPALIGIMALLTSGRSKTDIDALIAQISKPCRCGIFIKDANMRSQLHLLGHHRSQSIDFNPRHLSKLSTTIGDLFQDMKYHPQLLQSRAQYQSYAPSSWWPSLSGRAK